MNNLITRENSKDRFVAHDFRNYKNMTEYIGETCRISSQAYREAKRLGQPKPEFNIYWSYEVELAERHFEEVGAMDAYTRLLKDMMAARINMAAIDDTVQRFMDRSRFAFLSDYQAVRDFVAMNYEAIEFKMAAMKAKVI